jgi:hypothetical protein
MAGCRALSSGSNWLAAGWCMRELCWVAGQTDGAGSRRYVCIPWGRRQLGLVMMWLDGGRVVLMVLALHFRMRRRCHRDFGHAAEIGGNGDRLHQCSDGALIVSHEDTL